MLTNALIVRVNRTKQELFIPLPSSLIIKVQSRRTNVYTFERRGTASLLFAGFFLKKILFTDFERIAPLHDPPRYIYEKIYIYIKPRLRETVLFEPSTSHSRPSTLNHFSSDIFFLITSEGDRRESRPSCAYHSVLIRNI